MALLLTTAVEMHFNGGEFSPSGIRPPLGDYDGETIRSRNPPPPRVLLKDPGRRKMLGGKVSSLAVRPVSRPPPGKRNGDAGWVLKQDIAFGAKIRLIMNGAAEGSHIARRQDIAES